LAGCLVDHRDRRNNANGLDSVSSLS
jgi:hypothetical protein